MNESTARTRTLLQGTISGYAAFGLTAIFGLLTIRIGLNNFGTTAYGIWLVIYTLLSYFQLANFGIGHAAMNAIAHTSDPAVQRGVIRRTLVLLTGTSTLILVLLIIARSIFSDWSGTLGTLPLELKSDATNAIFFSAVLFVIQLPTTIFSSAFSGLQKIHWTRIYTSLSAAATLIATWAAAPHGSLMVLAIYNGFAVAMVGIISGAHLLISHPELRPWHGNISASPNYRSLAGTGINFVQLQIFSIIILNTDNLIISHRIGPDQVSTYAVAFKLFFMGILLVNMTGIVLWPIYAKSMKLNQWEWVNKTYNHNLRAIAVFAGAFWLGGTLFSQDIIGIWVGPEMYGGGFLVITLGGYIYMTAISGNNMSILNALNPSYWQVLILALEATLNVILSLILISKFGISGVALGTLMSAVIAHSWLPQWLIQRRTEGRVLLKGGAIIRHLTTVLLPCLAIAFPVSEIDDLFVRITASSALLMTYLIISWRFIPEQIRKWVHTISVTAIPNNRA